MKYKVPFRESLLVWILFFMMMVMIGCTFNFYVIVGNGGKMPVQSFYKFETDSHFSFVEGDEVNYFYLTDIIPLGKSIWSIGDFIMLFGTGCFFLLGLIYIINLKLEEIKFKKC
jgi:hypothetical protein